MQSSVNIVRSVQNFSAAEIMQAVSIAYSDSQENKPFDQFTVDELII